MCNHHRVFVDMMREVKGGNDTRFITSLSWLKKLDKFSRLHLGYHVLGPYSATHGVIMAVIIIAETSRCRAIFCHFYVGLSWDEIDQFERLFITINNHLGDGDKPILEFFC